MKQIATIILVLISLTSFGQGSKYTVKGNGSGGSNVGDSVKKNTDTLVVHNTRIGKHNDSLISHNTRIGANTTNIGINTSDILLKSPIASPTFTGTVTIPTSFKVASTTVTSTGTQLNYLNAATGTTGTTSTNLVYSTSPILVTPVLGAAAATSLTMSSFNTSLYTARIGNLVIQPYSLNNAFINENMYFNSSVFTPISTGYSTGINLANGQLTMLANNTQSGGTTITSPFTFFKGDYLGRIGIGGGNVAGGVIATLNDFTGSTLFIDSNKTPERHVGIGTTSPLSSLHIVFSKQVQPRGLTVDNTINDIYAGSILLRHQRDSSGTTKALRQGDNIGAVAFSGYNGSYYAEHSGIIQGQAAENFSTSNYGTSITFQNVKKGVGYNVVMPMVLGSEGGLMLGNVQVGGNIITQDTTAALQIETTTKGLLLPRLTKAQRDAITSPPAGLMIYQTDNTPGLRVRNSTNWIKYTETTD